MAAVSALVLLLFYAGGRDKLAEEELLEGDKVLRMVVMSMLIFSLCCDVDADLCLDLFLTMRSLKVLIVEEASLESAVVSRRWKKVQD